MFPQPDSQDNSIVIDKKINGTSFRFDVMSGGIAINDARSDECCIRWEKIDDVNHLVQLLGYLSVWEFKEVVETLAMIHTHRANFESVLERT